jgi:hypothetical protein
MNRIFTIVLLTIATLAAGCMKNPYQITEPQRDFIAVKPEVVIMGIENPTLDLDTGLLSLKVHQYMLAREYEAKVTPSGYSKGQSISWEDAAPLNSYDWRKSLISPAPDLKLQVGNYNAVIKSANVLQDTVTYDLSNIFIAAYPSASIKLTCFNCATLPNPIPPLSSHPAVIQSAKIPQPPTLSDVVSISFSGDDFQQIRKRIVSRRVSDAKLAAEAPKPELTLVRTAFNGLSTKEKTELSQKYHITFYDNNSIGLITERQVQNVSQTGSTVGSDVGSSLASAVYINNAIPKGSYNMWTDIAIGVLGGIAGSGGNKAPIEQYVIVYTIKNLDGDVKTATVRQSSTIGHSVGACYNLANAKVIEGDYCRMTTEKIREKYFSK